MGMEHAVEMVPRHRRAIGKSAGIERLVQVGFHMGQGAADQSRLALRRAG